MNVSKTSISNATSYQEMGEFWDQIKEVEFEVDIQSVQKYYRVERTLSDEIVLIAGLQGIGAETLLNLWIQEKISLANV
ncbi:MAG: hypothetical protein DRR19_04185 [Candidatus Parabeggiatoa sp. nov. 1]|nr:MAG: hypothetical protein DRR19_04185 [Gammaproteobacteria bacterium]